MSPTHDMNLANQSGASFRADLNNALQAILTNNSSASAPSTTAAYMFWADTNTGILKIRNSSNDAWIELLQLDGTLTLEDGSASAVALGFRDELNTGIFSSGANNFDVSIAGTTRLNISASGINITGTVTDDGATHDGDVTFTGASANIVFDKSDNALEFADNAKAKFGNAGDLEIFHNGSNSIINDAGTGELILQRGGSDILALTSTSAKVTGLFDISATGNDAGMRIIDSSVSGNSPNFEIIGKRSDSNANTSFAANIFLGKNRTDAKVSSGIILGSINFGGNHTDGTEGNISYAASIRGVASDSFDSKTDMPTDIIFCTGTSGADRTGESAGNSNAGTERLRINSSGILLSPSTYTNTSSSSANMTIPNSDGQIYRSTSSRKYKTNITTLTDTLADKILSCNPVSYTSLCTSDDKTKVHYGFIAEEVHEIDTSLVFYDNEAETPEPEGVQYDRFIPALVNLVKRQKTQIQTLETKVAALEAA